MVLLNSYFRAANPSSTERHIYSVPLPASNSFESVKPAALTDNATPGYYDANFSPKAGFYLLNYQGPSVPWQRVVQVEKPGMHPEYLDPYCFSFFRSSKQDFNYVLTDNTRLNNTIAEFETPIITYSTIDSDGYGQYSTLNRMRCLIVLVSRAQCS